MSYLFTRMESVQAGVRRIAKEQIADGIDKIADETISAGEAIHQVRKTCKKLRGLIRLVRPSLGGTYKRENRRFRDIARTLSDLRDAETVIETFDWILDLSGEDSRKQLTTVRDALVKRKKAVWGSSDSARSLLEDAGHAMAAAASDVDDWKLSDGDFDAIRGGLSKTYRRARSALDTVRKHSGVRTDENHEWRKRVKYHWYHLRLLGDVWPAISEPWTTEAHRLSRLLGAEHDCAVLREVVTGELLPDIEKGAASDLLRMISQRRDSLVDESIAVGTRLCAERPKALVRRMNAYWTAWRDGG